MSVVFGAVSRAESSCMFSQFLQRMSRAANGDRGRKNCLPTVSR